MGPPPTLGVVWGRCIRFVVIFFFFFLLYIIIIHHPHYPVSYCPQKRTTTLVLDRGLDPCYTALTHSLTRSEDRPKVYQNRTLDGSYTRAYDMKLTEKRISELADLICDHIAHCRYIRALLIAQYLRARMGWHTRNYRTIKIGE